MSLHKAISRCADRAIEADGRWLICESAIVSQNEDPEKQGRLKVVIPSIDESLVYDDWVRPAGQICLGDGLGSLFLPPKGSEVFITGVLGQKYNLVYHTSAFNEDMTVPAELGIDTPGIKVPKNLSFIAGLLALLRAQNIQIISAELAKMTGQNIQSFASQLHKSTGQNIEVIAEQLAKIHGESVTVEASGLADIKGNEVKIEGSTITANGTTVSIDGSGAITIHGGAVAISGTVVTIEGRLVRKSGPPI